MIRLLSKTVIKLGISFFPSNNVLYSFIHDQKAYVLVLSTNSQFHMCTLSLPEYALIRRQDSFFRSWLGNEKHLNMV